VLYKAVGGCSAELDNDAIAMMIYESEEKLLNQCVFYRCRNKF